MQLKKILLTKLEIENKIKKNQFEKLRTLSYDLLYCEYQHIIAFPTNFLNFFIFILLNSNFQSVCDRPKPIVRIFF